MIKIKSTQANKTYRVYLRNSYSGIRTTKQLLDSLDKAITRYENRKGWETYGQALRKKFEAGDYLDILMLFGMISKKVEI